MKNLKQIAKEKSIELIMDSALQLMSKSGFDSVSMRDIAKLADISPGLIYNYFASKEELLRCIFIEGNKDILESFNYKSNTNPIIEFENYLTRTFELVERKKIFWKLLHSIRNQSHLMELVQIETQEVVNIIFVKLNEMILQLGIEKQISVFTLFAMIDGAITHYLLLPNYPLNQTKKEIITLIKGLQNAKNK